MLRFIKKVFNHSFEKEWYETYWAFDLHGTLIKPTYKGISMEFYPYVIETLKILNDRPDIKMILWTSSFPHEIRNYLEGFKEKGIYFDSINENPGISSNNGNFGYYEKKFYFNILFDDKAGFDPDTEWQGINEYLIECNKSGYLPNPNWTTKF